MLEVPTIGERRDIFNILLSRTCFFSLLEKMLSKKDKPNRSVPRCRGTFSPSREKHTHSLVQWPYYIYALQYYRRVSLSQTISFGNRKWLSVSFIRVRLSNMLMSLSLRTGYCFIIFQVIRTKEVGGQRLRVETSRSALKLIATCWSY